MSPNVTLAIIAGALVACGVYLITERSLSRILMGVMVGGNGVNLLFLVASGAAGGPPLIGVTPKDEMSDPLPQAMVLTAIVISLASVAFVLSLAYRQWRLTGSDDVPDDAEDELIRSLAQADQTSSTYDPETESTSLADEEDATA